MRNSWHRYHLNVEVDDSYFNARRVRGKRGALGETIVFGILKRQGKVYTEIVPDTQENNKQGVIRAKVALDSVIHADGWGGYNGLAAVGYEKHSRVDQGDNALARGNSHIQWY